MNSKIKIAFVIESLNIGGAEKSLITLLNQIESNSLYEIHLLMFVKGGELEKLLPRNIITHYVNIPKLNFIERVKYFLERRIFKKFRKKKLHNAQIYWVIISKKIIKFNDYFDVAIAYNQGLSTYFVSKFISAKFKVAWVNADYLRVGYLMENDYIFYANFNRIVTVSESCTKSFAKLINCFNLKIPIDTYVPDGVDYKTIQKLADEKLDVIFDTKKINIVTLGRLSKPKGQHIVIDIVKELIAHNLNFKWYLVGDGELKKYLAREIKVNNLSNYIELLGSKFNPYPYVKNCDIYVQTSISEGGPPFTLREAMVLKKPVITTNIPGVEKIVFDKYGEIIEINPKIISDAIIRLINNPRKIKDIQLKYEKDPYIEISNIELFHKLINNFYV